MEPGNGRPHCGIFLTNLQQGGRHSHDLLAETGFYFELPKQFAAYVWL